MALLRIEVAQPCAVFNDTFSIVSLDDAHICIAGRAPSFIINNSDPKLCFVLQKEKETPSEWTADQKGVDCSKRWRD